MERLDSHDERYPPDLLDLDPAPTMFVRGDFSTSGPVVAIVGARRASEEGRAIARSLGAAVARAGGVVVSGGALGVDAAAHTGALDVQGRTWVVLPTPLAMPQPKTNRAIFERALTMKGAWWSELESPGPRSAFRERNRIIAALASATVVVEARARSGTRYTADAALRLERPLWVVPWGLHDRRGEGGRVMIRQGASVLTRERDLIESVGLRVVPPRVVKAAPTDTPSARVEAMIGRSAVTPDWLAARLNLSIPAVLTALTSLELLGTVVESGGRFRRVRR